ncbi:hypothetical protein ACF1AO_32580 [Streptomyces longwoodensis]|uniref:hypothetical protein n=1 Tax=Streptomyces longwoodensis TaxID=68231 RepID=UPI0036FBD8A5
MADQRWRLQEPGVRPLPRRERRGLYTFPCNGGAYQKWTTTSGSPKSIRHDWSGTYLDANGRVGATVGLQPTISTASRWVIDPV